MAKRPAFLSNKQVTCDFCGLVYFGNLNTENLILCWKCVDNLCYRWSEKQKLKFLAKFKGQKEKEKLIKRFIKKETLLNEEARDNTGHIARSDNNQGVRSAGSKIWQVQGDLFLDRAGAKVF